MDSLNETGIRLFFDEELFILKEKAMNLPSESQPPVVAEPEAEPYSIAFKGSNRKGVVVLYENTSEESLDASEETLLLNILKAVGLSLEDVAIINHHTAKQKWQDNITASKVIAFGIAPASYNLSCNEYTIINHSNAQWLFSHSLAQLADEKPLKAKLWGKLQELFPDK
ncbi:MAG: hypothetical protein KDC79_09855 [Cyclobacteriaceae bacterium]|nr:hypothetical protein [Cyclobacteriaceae bacterium]